jgi:hypothetical protein
MASDKILCIVELSLFLDPEMYYFFTWEARRLVILPGILGKRVPV